MNADRDRSGLPDRYPLREELELTPREAAALIGAGKVVLLDCRTNEEYAFAHIPGSIHIPLHEIESRHHEIEVPVDGHLAVICHMGMRSMRATLALRALGFESCRSVAGGIEAWSLGVDPGVARYELRSGAISRK
jgi:rhodanese-related sulfurtransferase